jgi:2-iminobutanoate/2-iminopropanoate deaminase
VPLSMIYEVDGTIYVSGHIAIEADGRLNGGDVSEQLDLIFRNIRDGLEAIGSGLDSVVKVTVMLAEAKRDFAAMNVVYARYFDRDPRPARSTIGIQIGADVLAEVEMIAVRGHHRTGAA